MTYNVLMETLASLSQPLTVLLDPHLDILQMNLPCYEYRSVIIGILSAQVYMMSTLRYQHNSDIVIAGT